MKMKYNKPYLAVESFQLNAAIAGSCAGENKLQLNYNLDNCNLDDDKGTDYGIQVFGGGCFTSVQTNDKGGCYNQYYGTDEIIYS